MSAKQIDGNLLFFRYVFPCAEDRLHQKLIDDSDFAECLKLVHDHDRPELAFIERCFPDAVKHFREYLRTKKTGFIFHMEAELVTEYWRNHHPCTGECAVRCGTISQTFPRTAEVLYEQQPLIVFNIFQLPLAVDKRVYFHKRVIAECVD